MAIQLAKAITGSKIIAMDLDDEKLKAKKEWSRYLYKFKKRRPNKISHGDYR